MFRQLSKQYARQLGFLGRRSMSTSRVSHSSKITRNVAVAGAALAIGGSFWTSRLQNIELDTPKTNELDQFNSVSVDSSIDPFPLTVSHKENNHIVNNFTLLGYGVRSVTFVSFKVYGIAIYIADSDLKKAVSILSDKKYLASLDTENHNLLELLRNPDHSAAIVGKLLDNDIKFLVRLSPVRNTDFNHLKDGLVKSILAHPISKAPETREIIAQGLEQLKGVFQGRKGSVPKNHLLYMEVFDGGSLNVTYENPENKKVAVLGQVKEPLISKTLLLQYLSGKKPLSESLRQSVVDGLVARAAL